jgi:hypothetical protein
MAMDLFTLSSKACLCYLYTLLQFDSYRYNLANTIVIALHTKVIISK